MGTQVGAASDLDPPGLRFGGRNLNFHQALWGILIEVLGGLCFRDVCPAGIPEQFQVWDSFAKAADELTSTVK